MFSELRQHIIGHIVGARENNQNTTLVFKKVCIVYICAADLRNIIFMYLDLYVTSVNSFNSWLGKGYHAKISMFPCVYRFVKI